jgi:hypothetical protein
VKRKLEGGLEDVSGGGGAPGEETKRGRGEAQAAAGQEDTGPLEAFQALLREKGVGPGSTWESWLPRLAFDPRFQLLRSLPERRHAFEAFVRARTEEERSGRVAQVQRQKEARSRFQQLLRERFTDLRQFYSLEEFAAAHGHEAAFQALSDARERERVFQEHLQELQRAALRSKQERREAQRAAFEALLREVLGAWPWPSSWREARRALERAHEDDPRYKDVPREEREALYEQLHRAERERVQREEARRRAQESEARRAREADARELERQRARMRREEAERDLRVALRERCRQPEQPWREARRALQGDPRYETRLLSESEKEALYRAHVTQLLEDLRADFRKFLAETGLELGTTWSDAQARLAQRDEARLRLGLPERERQTLFERHMRNMLAEAARDLETLLRDVQVHHYANRTASHHTTLHTHVHAYMLSSRQLHGHSLCLAHPSPPARP